MRRGSGLGQRAEIPSDPARGFAIFSCVETYGENFRAAPNVALVLIPLIFPKRVPRLEGEGALGLAAQPLLLSPAPGESSFRRHPRAPACIGGSGEKIVKRVPGHAAAECTCRTSNRLAQNPLFQTATVHAPPPSLRHSPTSLHTRPCCEPRLRCACRSASSLPMPPRRNRQRPQLLPPPHRHPQHRFLHRRLCLRRPHQPHPLRRFPQQAQYPPPPRHRRPARQPCWTPW